MTNLEDLIALSTPELIARAPDLTVADRDRMRAAAAQEWHRFAYGDAAVDLPRDEFLAGRHHRNLIVMATARVGEVYWPMDDDSLRVAEARGSQFVHALARRTLRGIANGLLFFGSVFNHIRSYERSGRLATEHNDDYVLAMMAGLGPSGSAPRTDVLRSDPELLERDFWRMLEIDGNRQVNLTSVDSRGGGHGRGGGWQSDVLDLAADATIDRARVLDATLAALGRDHSAYRTRWFVWLHKALAPSIQELSSRQAEYARLFRASAGPTVTLAVDAVAALESAGDLDAAVTTPWLSAAVDAQPKTTAIKAVRLAARIGSRAPAACQAVAAALGHPHGDVQAMALRELRQFDDAPARTAVRAAVPSLTPAVSAEAVRWLGDENRPASGAPAPAADRAGPSLTPITPIASHPELAEAFAVLLEDYSDADLIERAICAAARLGPEPSTYASLAKRANDLLGDRRLWESGGIVEITARIVLAAAGVPAPSPAPPPTWQRARILGERAAAIERALRDGRTFSPCAEPTHTGGWIAPEVLDARLRRGRPEMADAVAALLRVGPDPMQAAKDTEVLRHATTDRSTPVRAAFAYALGGVPPDSMPSADLPLWTAASRARAPMADDPALLAIGPQFDVGGLGRAPASRVLLFPDRRHERIVIASNATDDLPELFPTLDLCVVRAGRHREVQSVLLPWLSTIWPGNTGPVLADALSFQAGSHAGMTDHGASRHGLDLLTRTVSELPPEAKYVLAAGLGMPALADRACAVDAATALLPHRIAPAILASAMAELAPVVPLSRWASALADLSQAGRTAEVRAVLAELLPTIDRAARGLHTLVELLLDEHLRAVCPVNSSSLRDWLCGFGGGSKAARAAAAALSLK